MVKKENVANPTNGLLFGSNQQQTQSIIVVVSHDLLITDLSGDAVYFFKKPKNSIIHSSLLNNLINLNINTNPLVATINYKNTALVQTVELTHKITQEKYIFTITNLLKNDTDRYIVNISPANNSFRLLRSYVDSIINNLPGAVYWKDLEGRYMGCNKFVATMAGFNNPEDMIGKTDYDLCWKEFAQEWRILDNKVIDHNETLTREEHVKLANGEIITELTFKTPLKNEYNEIIGVIGTSLDITELKETQEKLKAAKKTAELTLKSLQQAQIEEKKLSAKTKRLEIENAKHKVELKAQAEFTRLVSHVYHDINTPLVSFTSLLELLSQLPPINSVDGYRIALITEPTRNENTVYILQTDTGLKYEVLGEKDKLNHGDISWDDILGELKKHVPNTHDDIPLFQKECLPVLINLIIQAKHAEPSQSEPRVPEHLRIVFRNLLYKCREIVNTLTSRGKHSEENNPDEMKQVILLSALVLQSIGEKSIEYTNKPIQFNQEFEKNAQFAFVKVQVSQLSRALSNLINNAIDAFDDKPGVVTLKLNIDHEQVQITIKDNGKGMSKEAIERIMNKEAFTEGKKNGNGIGFGQIHDALMRNNSNIHIQSKLGEGTEINLSFPKQQPPSWAIDNIEVTPLDTVVIVDDDDSIHWTWDNVFKTIIEKEPGIRIAHFQEGKKAINFIQSLNEKDKNNLLLLSDFELLKQDINGLDVIKAVNVKRAILVTSHYNEKNIQKQIINLGAKLLPKQLANDIPIRIIKSVEKHSKQNLKVVDAIWLDDDPSVTDLTCQLMPNLAIDVYRSPIEFMKNIEPNCIYAKDTPIFLDNNFNEIENITGISIAIKLHQLGFTKLRLLSGQDLDAVGIIPPDYLLILPKSAASNLEKYF